MKTIYVVEGSTGEYSDHSEWLVKAFTSEDAAKDFVVKADAIARELQSSRQSHLDYWKEKHPMDDKYMSDYTGTHYTYHSVELEET
jgi:hypothetical protein